jgi:hypothetical protein
MDMKKIAAIIQSCKSTWESYDIVGWLIPPALLLAVGCLNLFQLPEKTLENKKDTIIVSDKFKIDTIKIDTIKK